MNPKNLLAKIKKPRKFATTIRLHDDAYNVLIEIAKELGTSVTDVARAIVEDYTEQYQKSASKERASKTA